MKRNKLGYSNENSVAVFFYSTIKFYRDENEIIDASIKKIAKTSRKDTQDKSKKQDFER